MMITGLGNVREVVLAIALICITKREGLKDRRLFDSSRWTYILSYSLMAEADSEDSAGRYQE